MTKKPDLDEPTRRIAERLLSMPPKPHKEMKLGKSKANLPEAPGTSGVMIVYDVQTFADGAIEVGKPYTRFPDGTVAALIAS
jgi:hypothetical protein